MDKVWPNLLYVMFDVSERYGAASCGMSAQFILMVETQLMRFMTEQQIFEQNSLSSKPCNIKSCHLLDLRIRISSHTTVAVNSLIVPFILQTNEPRDKKERVNTSGTIPEWEYTELAVIVFFWDLFWFQNERISIPQESMM